MRWSVSLTAVIMVGVLAGFAAGTRGLEARQTASPAAGDPATVARQAIEALNHLLATGDTAGVNAAFAADYIDRTPGTSATGERYAPDRDGLKATFADFRAAIPDAEISIEDVITEADRVAVRFTFRGTPDQTAFGLPAPVTEPLQVGGAFIARVSDGQIAESWDYDQFADQLAALYAAPPAASTPAP
jgi:predicted ester cyclase